MEIKKDDRLTFYRRVAIGTGSSLMIIIGITLLGMSVFSPPTETKIALRASQPIAETAGVRNLIGSHEAQAAIDDHLENLADTLERVVNEPSADSANVNTGTVAEGEIVEARHSGETSSDEEITITLNKEDLKTAAEAGTATVGLWRLIWQAIWPRLQSFGGALLGIIS